MNRPLSRREAIQHLGLLGLGATAAACGSDGDDALEIPSSCVLTPRQAEGPYFIDTGFDRRDITEGSAGLPLEVRLRVVEAANGCAPIPDAVVEIWHSDAEGVYSGFNIDEGNLADVEGTTFLRGFQTTDRNGRVEFETIFPGWYPIRAVHIHVKVLLAGNEQVTTQIYFDQATVDRIMTLPPYAARGPVQTRNETDILRTDDVAGDLMFTLDGPDDDLIASHIIGIA